MNNSNTYICPIAILDADFGIKVGRIRKYNILEDILPNYIGKLLIHKYVYENEVLTPKEAKNDFISYIVISTQRGFIEKFDPNMVLAIFTKTKYIAI